MAVFTNVGLNLLATAVQTNGADVAVTYVSVGLGAGTLASGLTNGTMYSSLSLQLPLANSIASSQSLTLIDSVGDTMTITATGTNSAGSSTINVITFTANANYAVGSGVVNTPLATDTALQNEFYRLAATPGAAGAGTGESLNAAYFDPTTTTNFYLEVGFWGGSTATSSLGTGTLICRDVQYWNHVNNADSAFFQMDSTL